MTFANWKNSQVINQKYEQLCSQAWFSLRVKAKNKRVDRQHESIFLLLIVFEMGF